MRRSNNSLDSVIFDLDGTLTDPGKSFVNCVGFALTSLGKEEIPADQDLYGYIGPPVHGTFASLLQTSDPDLIEQAVGLYRKRLGAEGISENFAYAGVREMLSSLRGAGCALFVATAKPVQFAAPILLHCGLADYFDGIYGSEMGQPNTPKADLIRAVLSERNLSASTTAMVGDRRHDIEGAIANSVFAVGVTYGYGSDEELTRAGADVLCNTPVEVRDALTERDGRCRSSYPSTG
jgi:phosphoglycolate phosphatase